ncbi:hypothetical protein KVR01_002115 [Diaporthe batatas]|uniref:uncharacterized protein n=1 Tax=Diaporthe batatas TaxID=748121 RepID=UPI001D04F50C|nr:uncharacterized protein KVR01_002115 [Diaporthe batatas]KAG8166426.1 hypothetical protein KVR01_002115 [Diaporthe batatas]
MKTFKALIGLASVGLVTAQTAITVNIGTTYQQIDGFGFSQAFGPVRRQGLDYLFNTTTGAGFTIIRNRIGSGGSGDSILPNSPGSPAGNPAYSWNNDDSGQVWLSQEAMRYGVKTIYADAWSAPGFMKTNGVETNGGYLCGTTGHSCSSGDWRQAYANFLVKYVQYYKDAGIPVTHLGFLNEPDYTVSYSSMLINVNNPVEVTSFLPILSATLQSAGLDTQVKIACCDTIGWGNAKTVAGRLISAGVENYLGLLTSHMYTGDPNSAITGTKLPVWMTEGADLSSPWATTWYNNGGLAEGLTWANKVATGILNANLSGYIYWQGLEVNQGQASSYLVAVLDSKNAIPSGRLFALTMWSRFVRPGAVRVGTSGTISGVAIGAFKNADGSVVVIFTNSGGSAQSSKISFNGFSPSAASAWLTDNSHSVTATVVTLSGGAVTVQIPARSVVTVKLT